MEFEVLENRLQRLEAAKEMLEREGQRAAIAFGATKWYYIGFRDFHGDISGVRIRYCICSTADDDIPFLSIEVGPADKGCKVDWNYETDSWDIHIVSQYLHLMACGLYRLGFEEESILSQIPSLSAHEKLELRLSMPREFWPQKWLDEGT